MEETSLTMLEGLKLGDSARWERFERAYEGFIRNQFARLCNWDDAQELSQDVLMAVARGIGEFSRERTGSFRAWLRTISRRRASKFLEDRSADRMALARLGELAEAVRGWDNADSELSRCWDREHEAYWAERLTAELRNRHNERDLDIYQQRSRGVETAEVARQYDLTPQAVFVIVGRVRATMNKLVEEWSDVLDL